VFFVVPSAPPDLQVVSRYSLFLHELRSILTEDDTSVISIAGRRPGRRRAHRPHHQGEAVGGFV